MNILVTGASGFVGRALCRALLSVGSEVTCVGRVCDAVAKVAVGDIGPGTDWRPSLRSRTDAVVHLAARVHVMQDTAIDPLAEFRKVNVEGTLNLARQVLEAGVRRFVYLSSIKVNGEMSLPGQPLLADDPPAPQDAYAISKCEAEQVLLELAAASDLEVVIIRPPLVYGPGVRGNFASLTDWVLRGIPLPLGAVNNRRSLVALDNLVDLIVQCADRERSPQAANQVFLVSDGEDVSTPELLRRVAHAHSRKARLVPLPAGWLRWGARVLGRTDMAERLLSNLQVDDSKVRELIGWRPVVTMEQQLRKMARDMSRV